MDRISQLPDCIIHSILSFLPIKEAVRTSILSKSWKRVCSSYKIQFSLHLDHNSFALQKLIAAESEKESDLHEIRDKFMEYVRGELIKLCQQNSPVLKLVLDTALIDEEYRYVDELLELVMQTKVEELCLFVQSNDCRSNLKVEGLYAENWEDVRSMADARYDFPYDVLVASKWLQSLTVGCKFTSVLNYSLDVFSSLRHLWLTQVMVWDESVLINLAYCCPEIELIEFNSCALWIVELDLSIFRKLKKASVIGYQFGMADVVDLTEITMLESFYCDVMECMWGIDIDSRTTIRELTLHDFYYHFNDLDEAFPFVEDAKLMIDSVQEHVDRFVTSSVHLKRLDVSLLGTPLRMIYVHCENLRYFNYEGGGFGKVDIDCPNLRQFNYLADYLPDKLKLNLSTNVCCINFGLHLRNDLNTSWFIHLRNCLEKIAGREICLQLHIESPKVEFVLDEFGEILPSFQLKKVHLKVKMNGADMQNPAALLDGLVWTIHPAILTITGPHCLSFVEVLCERLDSMNGYFSCCENLSSCTKCWWHNLVDVDMMMNRIEDTENDATEFCFILQWHLSSCPHHQRQISEL